MTGRAILRLSPIALLVLVAACGGGGTKTVTVTQTVVKPEVAARIYLLRDGKVAPVSRLLPGSARTDLVAALDRGPTAAERAAGLSSAMSFGADLGTRKAQIVYTLTQFDPAGVVELDGKKYRRAEFEAETPAILVESPLPESRVTSPIHATGTANTFEATFQYELKDAAGKILAKHFVTATSGNGVRGTFDVSIPFTVTKEQPGTLTVYEDSAATGKRVSESAIPLTLAP